METGAASRRLRQRISIRGEAFMLGRLALRSVLLFLCCGFSIAQNSATQNLPAPTLSTTPALNGAVIAALTTTTPGAKIYYTLDGSTPTTASQIYQAPFLVASNLTVKAIATNPAKAESAALTQAFSPHIARGTLVWSDEFNYPGAGGGQPNPHTWTYDTGHDGFGNHEQETYCAWNSNASPCSASESSATIGVEGHLHVVARQISPGVFTSARLKSQGLFSFMYGRIEARMKLPESQGMWPAFWMLGNNIATIDWPSCGELDIMEHIDGSKPPDTGGGPVAGYDWIAGSVHGGPSGSAEINGTERYHPAGFSAADWHTYGMIWMKGEVQYYVDDAAKPYATFKATDPQWTNHSWPFDAGPQFILLNLAIGGDWPGNVDGTTVLPSEMLVDYVRIYAN